MIKAADKKTTTAKQNKTTNKRTTHLLFTSISFDFIYVFLFLCRLMFETITTCGWLKVSSEKLILLKNVTVTTLKNEQLKASRNVTKLTRKAFLSFCFPCSFTIHVNWKLMRTIFYSHNKFTSYTFHNSPDILARLINLTLKKIQLKEIGWVHSFLRIPLNTAESGQRTGSANFSNTLSV